MLFICSLLFGQKSQTPETLNLLSGSFTIGTDADRLLTEQDIVDWPSFNNMQYGIVALKPFPSVEQQQALSKEGIEFLSFWPGQYYLIGVAVDANLSALNQYTVVAQSAYQDAFRFSSDFAEAPSRVKKMNGKVRVNIHPFSNIDLDEFSHVLSNMKINVAESRSTYHFIQVEVDEVALDLLRSHAGVQFLDWAYDYGEPENYTARTAHRTSYLGSDNSNGLAYAGQGINVMLQDDGAIGPHIDHHGRIGGQFWPVSTGNHGDHVGGTITGAGNLNPRHEGQAREADLYVYKAAPEYQGFDSIDIHYNSKNIVITSTSYSNGCNAGYTALARTMDEQVNDYESLIHVFSAGNSGTSNCGYGAGNYWGNITGGHKVGKNVITVANLDQLDVLNTSSSRGPAHDGRIKPDISAKGTNVTSTIAGNQYDTYTGTSMSCPGVSGTLAVLYSAYEDLNSQLPPSGLIKALVLNTADDLGNTGPDFKHGWGRINAKKAFEAMDAGNIITGTVANGDSTTLSIAIPSNTPNARFMLYWTDPNASVNAQTALVNDLDLVVKDPSDSTHYPYLLNHAANAVTLNDPAGHGVDQLNNMEQVEFFAPQAGSYEIKITGSSVPMGPQEYFLVYWFEPETLELTYPVGREKFEPLISEIIRWDRGGITGTVNIEYSPDGGQSWYTVNSVQAEQGYYNWSVPNLVSGKARVRVLQNSVVLSESSDFSIINIPNGLGVGSACPDSLVLDWQAVNGATSYTIYRLGEKYMDSIGTSTVTNFADLDVNPYDDMLWYSVSANGPDLAESKRHNAIQHTPGLLNCFMPYDIEVTTGFPDIHSIYTCGSDSQTVGVAVQNLGQSPITAFDAAFLKNDTVLISESFTTNLNYLDYDTVYFSTPYGFGENLTEYEFEATLTNDANPYNDTLLSHYQLVESEKLIPIWVEDFENQSFCSTDNDCGATECPLTDGWSNEQNGVIDDVDFRVNSGGTPSNGTGPGSGNGGTGRYVYIESSGECTFKTASLISPCIDLTDATNALLIFWYNMNGQTMGELHVDIHNGDFWTMDVMPAISGNQGSTWKSETVDLSAFSGSIINIRFRGITGSNYLSDIALDDIGIMHLPIAAFDFATQPDGSTVLFTDQSHYGEQQSFDLGDGTPLADSVVASHSYSQQMNYTVTQIVTNSFGSDTAVHEINNLGSAEISAGSTSLYPNPTRGLFRIESTQYDISSLQVFSIDGRMVSTLPLTSGRAADVDLRHLAPGHYILFVNGNSQDRHELIIQD